jgi:hypothetical protein
MERDVMGRLAMGQIVWEPGLEDGRWMKAEVQDG